MAATQQQLDALVRGTVVWVDLDPGEGAEQRKLRPCVIVSSNTLNRKLRTIIIVPISSLKGRKPYPHEVVIPEGEGGLDRECVAQPIQVRTVDRDIRVCDVKGSLTEATMAQIGFQLFAALGGLP